MRRKFTVYGLRFSKTSFWNHINTGFPDPAVATVLTACGIETKIISIIIIIYIVATVLTACGIETEYQLASLFFYQFELQQYLPLAVLKLIIQELMRTANESVATVLTACGIETNK